MSQDEFYDSWDAESRIYEILSNNYHPKNLSNQNNKQKSIQQLPTQAYQPEDGYDFEPRMNAFRILQESHEAILRSFLRVDPDFWLQVAGAHSLLRLRDVGGACGTVPFRNLAVNIRKSPGRLVNHVNVSTLVWLVISEFRRSFMMCVKRWSTF